MDVGGDTGRISPLSRRTLLPWTLGAESRLPHKWQVPLRRTVIAVLTGLAVAAVPARAQDTVFAGTYRLEVQSTRIPPSTAVTKPSVMVLVLGTGPLDLGSLDNKTRTFLTIWYIGVGPVDSANACFTNTKGEGGLPYRVSLAFWSTPRNESPIHVTTDRSPDDDHVLTLGIVRGQAKGDITHHAANPGEFNGVQWTVQGARVGPPDPAQCFAATQSLVDALDRRGPPSKVLPRD